MSINDWDGLERALGAMASSGCMEVREDGEWLAELASLRWQLHTEGKTPLVHLWSDGCNLTRKIVSVREQSAERIVLEVQRFSRAKPGRLEFLRSNGKRTAGRVTREQFRARFERFLAERFPDAVVDLLSASPDLEHSFSGVYVRGRMREAARAWAVLAAAPGETSAAIEGILAFAILWLAWTRDHSERHAVEGARIFVPAGSARYLRERVLGLSSAASTEIFEYDERGGPLRKVDPAEAGNLESWLIPRGEVETGLAAAIESASRIRALTALLAENPRRVTGIVLPHNGEVAFCFHGLAFARWSRDGIRFGLGDKLERLTSATEPAFEKLVRQLDLHRNSLAAGTKHSLYRAAPERWLETLVLEDPGKLDAQLDPRNLYSQVPALTRGDRGVIDLLGVTRRGRLVVIELKASEDIQLPMQAVDYWLRVRRHQLAGDFQRFGYFAGVEIDPKPPLVWLVAPGLHFHPATDTLLKYLSPEIKVSRVGLNENWRRGLKIVFRQ